MLREPLRDLLTIVALIAQVAALAVMLEQGVAGFEGAVTFFLASISCLLWNQNLKE